MLREKSNMAEGSFGFRLGEFDCLVVSDGFLTVGPGKMDISCLLIKTGQRKILIDTGCGGMSAQTKAGKLLQNLQAEGVSAAEIDMVVHTHAHSDHIGGNAAEHAKRGLPDARPLIHQKEWAYCTE